MDGRGQAAARVAAPARGQLGVPWVAGTCVAYGTWRQPAQDVAPISYSEQPPSPSRPSRSRPATAPAGTPRRSAACPPPVYPQQARSTASRCGPGSAASPDASRRLPSLAPPPHGQPQKTPGRRCGRRDVAWPCTIHRAAPRDRHDPAQPAARRRPEPRRGPPHLHQYLPGHLLRPGLIPDDPAHQAINRAGDLITDTCERLSITPAPTSGSRPSTAATPGRPSSCAPAADDPVPTVREPRFCPTAMVTSPHTTPVNDHRAARVRDSTTTQRCHTLTQPGPDIHNHPAGLIRPPQ